MRSSSGAVRGKRILNPVLLLWLVFAAIAALRNTPELKSQETVEPPLLETARAVAVPSSTGLR